MDQTDQARTATDISRPSAMKFVVLLGIVSLFGDMTYEGARSITGPYLTILGASGTAVGFIAGFGELFGYVFRLASGYVSDRTGRCWRITIAGYAINLFSVPLLALAGHWGAAAALMIAERTGRAIRTPARDAMLSHAGTQTGLGWAFGLHEALDSTGAVLGPLAISGAIYLGADYRTGFAGLAIPAVLSIATLLAARRIYPRPHDFERAAPEHGQARMPRMLWVYIAAVAFIAAGYVDFPLIAYHFQKTSLVPAPWIPLLYAIAMASAALSAVLLGRAYDRLGMRAMILATLSSAATAPLAYLGGVMTAVIAMVFWGIGMGAQESVMRAAVAFLAPAGRRATAYGIFNAGYGIAWFAGSALLGILYDVSVMSLVIASVVLQLLALPVLWWIAWHGHGPRADRSGVDGQGTESSATGT